MEEEYMIGQLRSARLNFVAKFLHAFELELCEFEWAL